jgi:plastocyanin
MEEKKSKKTTILYVVIGVLLILLLVSVFILGKNSNKEVDNETEIPSNVVEEGEDESNKEQSTNLNEEDLARIELVESSRIEVEGTNLITPDDKVINSEGKNVKTNVSLSDASAPALSATVERAELSEKVVDIEASMGRFNPNTFIVSPGQSVTIALTSVDKYGHSLVFRGSQMKSVALIVRPGDTRAITFNAPEQIGDYEFYCNIGGDKYGHSVRGEIGKMIVE